MNPTKQAKGDQALFVRRLDNAIQRINRYPVGKVYQNKPHYPLDSDLRWIVLFFKQPGSDVLAIYT